MDLFWLGVAALLLGMLQSALYRWFGLAALRYQRAFSKPRAFEGEEVELIEVIRNAKPLPLPWLRVESRMSPHLRFGSQEDLEITGDQYHRSVFFLGMFSQVTRRHRVRLLKRGYYPVGSVALTSGDLFGGSQQTLQLDTKACITVYPRLMDASELDLPSSRWQGDLLVKRWIVSDPFLVSGIRQYQPGDMQRDIHWGATARTGVLQVKTHEHTADPRLLVLLNVQAAELQWGDLMDYEQDVIERGISLAATVLVKALEAGVEVGFAANAPVWGSETPIYLPPRRSPTQAEELLDALARLRILRVRNFPSLLDDLGKVTGMDILLLSCYDSALIEEKIALLRAMGNTVQLHLLGGGEVRHAG